MKTQQEITPSIFGEIKISESTGSYISKTGQTESETHLQIKMYPTEPNNNASVELPSQSISGEMLLVSFKNKVTVTS